MSAYFKFEKFITTGFIMVVYILGAIALTVISILLIAGSPNIFGVSSLGIILGVIFLILGNLFWRILCEYWIVQFRIFTELVEINKTLKGGQAAVAAPPTPHQTVNNPQAGQVCPTCGGPLIYVQQYQRWYCQREGKYV
jgi:hypothetical protein